MTCGGDKDHHDHGRGHHGYHGRSCGCGCDTPFRFGPCFATREEKVEWLERVLEGLREEVQAVEERIAKLRGEA